MAATRVGPNNHGAAPSVSEGSLIPLLGRIAGIAGISAGVLLTVYRQLLRLKLFPTLPPERAYDLLLLIVLLTFAFAIGGLAAWLARARTARWVVVSLLLFALGMSALGATLIRGDKESATESWRQVSNAPQSFYFDYPFKDAPGRHIWTRTNEKLWTERLPNGNENFIEVVGRTSVDGDNGTLVQLSNDKSLQYFVPDRGSHMLWVRDRRVDANQSPASPWLFLGQMQNVN